MTDEKKEIQAAPRPSYGQGEVEDQMFDPKASEDDFEVFKKTSDGVDFRLVGWPKASVIFLKGELVFKVDGFDGS